MFYRYKDCRGYFYDKTFENFPAVSSHGRESKKVDFGFQSLVGFQILELYSGFQSQGLPIPQAKFSPIPESGFPYMGRTVPITRGEGGGGGEWEWRWYSRFQMKGMIEWGQKSNPQKNPQGFQQNLKRSLDQILTPKFPKAKFGCTLLGELRGHESSDCLNTLKKSLLKSIHPKKYSPNFPTQINPGIKNVEPKNSRSFIIVSD